MRLVNRQGIDLLKFKPFNPLVPRSNRGRPIIKSNTYINFPRRILAPSATIIFKLLNKYLFWSFKSETFPWKPVHFLGQYI